MTRASSEPHRRHVGGVTWTRDEQGRYSTTKIGKKTFCLYPFRSALGSWTGIDLVKIETEKRAVLDAQRALNAARTK